MAWWVPAVQVGVSLYGAYASSKAGDDVNPLVEANIQANREEAWEDKRRATLSFRHEQQANRVQIARSGFIGKKGITRTSDIFMQTQRAEFDREIDWMDKAADRRSQVIALGGTVARAQAKSDTIRQVAGAAGHAANAYDQWKSSQT